MWDIKRNISKTVHGLTKVTPRVKAFAGAMIMVSSMLLTLPLIDWWAGRAYKLSDTHASLVGTPNPELAKKLVYNHEQKMYEFNADEKPVPEDLDPSQMTPKQLKKIMGSEEKQSNLYSLDLHQDGSKGVTFYDTNLDMSFSLVPQFKVGKGYKIDDRLIYPIDGAKAVYTVKGNGLKEDILYDKAPKDGEAKFEYRMDLPKELEARLHQDGSVGVYSGDPMLFGNISASLEEDQERLRSAREHAEKTHLVFNIPAPIIVTEQNTEHKAQAWFSLNGGTLTLSAKNLHSIKGAFSIDPTVVVTSTADFQSGNNEGDITFGTDQISRKGITGGSIGSWAAANSFTDARDSHASVVHNGRLYVLGGYSDGPTYYNDVRYATLNSNGTLGTWGSTVSFTTARRWHSAVVYSGTLYVIGGFGGTYLDDIQYTTFKTNGTLNSWSTTTNLPAGRRQHATVAYGGYMYILGGAASTATADVLYASINADGTLGTWTATTSFTTARTLLTAVAYNGYMYIAGGIGSSGLNDVQYAPINADGTVGTWTATTSFTTARSGHSSIVRGGYLYIFGGYSSNPINDVQYAPINADGTVGTWTATTVLPEARRWHTTEIHNDYIYFIGGHDGTAQNNTVHYSPIHTPGVVTSYATTTNLPTYSYSCGLLCTTNTSNKYGHASVVHGGYIYVLGGEQENATTSAVASVHYAPLNANGTIGTWTATNSMTTARKHHQAVVYGGRIYATGGQNASNSVQGTVEYATINANGTVGTWATTTAMNSTRYGHASVAYNGYLYAIAGTQGTPTYITNTEYAPINSNGTVGSWTAATSLPTARSWLTAVVSHGNIYILGGYEPNPTTVATTHVHYANINSNGSLGTWNSTTNFSGARRSHTTVVLKGNIYVIGGHNGNAGGYYSDTQFAPINSDGTVGTWTTTSSFTTSRFGHASVVINDYVYVLGGYNGSHLGDIQYARINNGGAGSTGSYSAANSFSASRFGHTSVAYNGYLYVIGGSDGSTSYLNDVQYAPINSNGTIGTWNTTTSFTTGRRYHTSVAYNGYLYVIGGTTASPLNDVQYAPINSNGTIGTWNTTTSFTSARYNHTSVTYNGYLYVLGGDDGDYLNDVQYAPINSNGTIGTWNTTTSFTTSRGGHSSVAINGYIYVIGGIEFSYLNDVQYAPINSNGTIGTWNTTTSFTTTRFGHTTTAYNGHLYITGGYNASYLNDVQYAPINSNGTIGTWNTTTSFTTGRRYHTSAAHNGYLYVIGGSDGNGTYRNDVQYAPLNTMPRGARYTKVVDLGSVAQLRAVTPTATYPTDVSNITYRAAGASGMFGSYSDALSLRANCALNTRYVLITVEMNDGSGSVYSDSAYGSSVQDITAEYYSGVVGISPEVRMQRGKHFSSQILQPLDTQKLISTAGGC